MYDVPSTQQYYKSLTSRGFDSLVLLNANDADVFDFIQNFPAGAKQLRGLSLRYEEGFSFEG